MRKFLIYSQFCTIVVYHAIDEQNAKDLCSQDAGYRDAKNMTERLDGSWDLFIKELKPCTNTPRALG